MPAPQQWQVYSRLFAPPQGLIYVIFAYPPCIAADIAGRLHFISIFSRRRPIEQTRVPGQVWKELTLAMRHPWRPISFGKVPSG